MKTMTAKFPGRCVKTGAPVSPGDTIIWHGRGRVELLGTAEVVDPDFALASSVDPELAQADPDAAAAAGRYLRRSMERSKSDFWRGADGREYYRNRRGLCEDAPCCGCCNS